MVSFDIYFPFLIIVFSCSKLKLGNCFFIPSVDCHFESKLNVKVVT